MKKTIFIFCLFIFSAFNGFSQWAQDSLSSGRSYFQAVTFANKVYFIGGLEQSLLTGTQLTSEVAVYNCITSTWDSSTAISSPRDYTACASGDLGIYVFGGRESYSFNGNNVDYGTNVVDIFKSGVWHTDTITDYLWGGVGLKVGSKILFTGFVDSINNITKEIFASDKVYIFDEISETWSTNTLSSPRWQLGAATNDTIAVFAGGVNGLGVTSDVVDIYNSITNTWSTSNLSVSRGYIGGAYTNGKFYFAGGVLGGVISNSSDVVDVYDGITWTTLQLSEPRAGIKAEAMGGKVYFMAGSNMDLSLLTYDIFNFNTNFVSDLSSPVDVLNTASGSWSRADLNNDLVDIASATWGNNIYVGGGHGVVKIWMFGSQITFHGFSSYYVQILDVTTGISDIAHEISFDVYPNPSTGPFTILLPENNAEILITDVLGQEVLKTKTISRKLDLQIEGNGMYIVYVKTREGTATRKLLVNH